MVSSSNIPENSTPETSTSTTDAWTWFQDSSDKFLLLFIIIVMLGATMHMLHHAVDSAQIQFMNGLTSTFAGGFMTLVTGAIIRKSSSASSTNLPTGASVATAKEEEK